MRDGSFRARVGRCLTTAGDPPPDLDAGERRARPLAAWCVVLASLGCAFAPVATDLYLPGLPGDGRDLGAAASGVQLTLTAFLVGLAFGQLVMGPLSDRFGRRRPLVVSATVCVAAGVVCALAPNLPVLAGGPAGAGVRRGRRHGHRARRHLRPGDRPGRRARRSR